MGIPKWRPQFPSKWWPPPSSPSLPLVLLITIRAGQILEHSPTSLSIYALVDNSLVQNHDPPCGRAGLALQNPLDTFASIPSFSRPPLVLSSSLRLSYPPRFLVLSSHVPALKHNHHQLGWQSLTLGINLTMRWLLLQGTSINAIKRLRDTNIRPINTKPSTRS